MNPITEVYLGDRVRWSSAAGPLTGRIIDIDIAKNAADEMVPWIVVETARYGRLRICGVEDYLRALHFRVLERAAYEAA